MSTYQEITFKPIANGDVQFKSFESNAQGTFTVNIDLETAEALRKELDDAIEAIKNLKTPFEYPAFDGLATLYSDVELTDDDIRDLLRSATWIQNNLKKHAEERKEPVKVVKRYTHAFGGFAAIFEAEDD
jgi:hypothetical protein